jgi:RNA recognition motif-containing protein
VSDDDVRALFASCGDIDYVRVVRDRDTRKGKGIAYVAFKVGEGGAFKFLT